MSTHSTSMDDFMGQTVKRVSPWKTISPRGPPSVRKGKISFLLEIPKKPCVAKHLINPSIYYVLYIYYIIYICIHNGIEKGI